MAESLVAATEGAGKNFHTFQRTIGVNVVEDSVVLQGPPYLAAYHVEPGASANTTTINKHMWQLMAGTTLNVYVHWIGIGISTLAGTATSLSVQIRRLSSAGTGGTGGSLNAWDATDAAAGATTMIMPSALGTESINMWNGGMIVPSALPTTPNIDGTLIWQWPPRDMVGRVKAIRIAAGTSSGICIKNTTALATATYGINAIITEANF